MGRRVRQELDEGCALGHPCSPPPPALSSPQGVSSMLRTTVRDCLYLNWALPAEALPVPPKPLRYQIHSWQGRDWVFASALLFHQDSLHFTALPRLRLGYPQLN